MRKTLPLAFVAVVAAAGVATPAFAAKPKPITESYAVTGYPVPSPLVGPPAPESANSCVDPRLEGVSTTTKTIKPTGAGTLAVEVAGFYGDWDITVLDGAGEVVVEGAGSTTGDVPSTSTGTETATATFKKGQEIRIAVCNYLGSPNAKAKYTYTYK